MTFNLKLLSICFSSILLFNCKESPKKTTTEPTEVSQKEIKFQNKGHQLVYQMTQKVGDYHTLREKKDVIYTYTYKTPDGKTNISTEKYLFDGEYSYGKYTEHQRTFPNLKGIIEQGYDGNEFWLKHNGKIITDKNLLKKVAFNRPTNFYWFAMMQKLLDPGLNYEHIGETTIDNNNYDIVKISFNSTADKPTDIYQLYINKKTSLVDQFLFTVADYGKMDIPNLMQLTYTEVDGMLIPSNRKYKKSDWNASVSDAPWVTATWSAIKFNNGLTQKDFTK